MAYGGRAPLTGSGLPRPVVALLMRTDAAGRVMRLRRGRARAVELGGAVRGVRRGRRGAGGEVERLDACAQARVEHDGHENEHPQRRTGAVGGVNTLVDGHHLAYYAP